MLPFARLLALSLILCATATAELHLLQQGESFVSADAEGRMASYGLGDYGPLIAFNLSQATTSLPLKLNETRSALIGYAHEKPCFSCAFTPEGVLKIQVDEAAPSTLQLTLKTMSFEALPAYLQDDQDQDHQVLITRLGPASIPGASAIFFPEIDVALSLQGAQKVTWQWDDTPKGHCTLLLKPGASTTIQVQENYFKETLGIPYYQPRIEKTAWPAPPAVALTWYGIKGWEGNPAQRTEWLHPEIDCVAEKLLPWAGQMVFQIDDNYPYEDDAYMRALSDYIRDKGLTPGIWFTPYGVVPAEEAQENPNAFLHAEDQSLLGAFAGVNWANPNQPGPDNVILNTHRPEVLAGPFTQFWRKVSETWNFDFFKIDGLPTVANRYRRAVDGGGIPGFRKGLDKARAIVGGDKFINGCYGIPLEGMGYLNGARTGPDAGSWTHANEVILKWNFLNNLCWWCDPDAAANQYCAPLHLARFNTLARVLSGQQFVTDDTWTKIPESTIALWRQALPTQSIFPVNLYPIKRNWVKYDTFNLRIHRAGNYDYDVVGLFNYFDKPKARELDLARLALDAPRVHVYEIWKQQYHGLLNADAKIPIHLRGHHAAAFSLIPEQPHPVLINSSRHLSQGGADVSEMQWTKEGDQWILECVSNHLVKNDPYILRFVTGPYSLIEAQCQGECVAIENQGCLASVRFTPSRSGSFSWRLLFTPASEARFGLYPEVPLDIRDEEAAYFTLIATATHPTPWKLRSSDSQIVMEPASGILPPWPAQQRIKVLVDAERLPRGIRLKTKIDILHAASERILAVGQVHYSSPPSEDLARAATASASSESGPGYAAKKVNDDIPGSRWSAIPEDAQGAWIELHWPQAQRFNRVVFSEIGELGSRIQGWTLWVGEQKLSQVAAGGAEELRRTVTLSAPVTASRLRLVLEKCVEEPTLSAIEVYNQP